MSTAAEGIRETASTLLAIADRLDGIDVSADAMRSGSGAPRRSDFLIGADRDGAVELRCAQLDGWCSWTHEPEGNEYTLEQLEQLAAEHQKEHSA